MIKTKNILFRFCLTGVNDDIYEDNAGASSGNQLISFYLTNNIIVIYTC